LLPTIGDLSGHTLAVYDARHSLTLGGGASLQRQTRKRGSFLIPASKNRKAGQKPDRQIYFKDFLACVESILTLITPYSAGYYRVVAGGGIEPPTQGFSVLCSTN
jgi:hypothetical protein